MSTSGIPLDANFKKLSCQLGGLRLNGIPEQGTALSNTVMIVDSSACVITDTSGTILVNKYIKINISGVEYLLPLYQS